MQCRAEARAGICRRGGRHSRAQHPPGEARMFFDGQRQRLPLRRISAAAFPKRWKRRGSSLPKADGAMRLPLLQLHSQQVFAVRVSIFEFRASISTTCANTPPNPRAAPARTRRPPAASSRARSPPSARRTGRSPEARSAGIASCTARAGSALCSPMTNTRCGTPRSNARRRASRSPAARSTPAPYPIYSDRRIPPQESPLPRTPLPRRPPESPRLFVFSRIHDNPCAAARPAPPGRVDTPFRAP